MSAKSKALTAGKWVARFLVLPWLIDRYVQGSAARLLKEAIGAVSGENPAPRKLVGSLQAELDKLVQGKVLPSLQAEMAAMRADLERRLLPPPVVGLPPRRRK